MKQQTRVGKILESLNKRRKFNEAWNIPSNLRDKETLKKLLNTEKLNLENR